MTKKPTAAFFDADAAREVTDCADSRESASDG